MASLKKGVFIAILIVIGAIEIVLYWNTHLFHQAKEKIKDTERKIEVLERANLFYPYNDLIYYELGKAYFDLGIKNISRKEVRETYLRESLQNYVRFLQINPASPFGHFNFAQSLLYMSYVTPTSDIDYFKEYKKAALLTGHHSEIFYEVGKILFSRWEWLSEEERDFTLEIIKKTLRRKERNKLMALLHTWEMNVKSYDVMDRILPVDSDVYRLYAQFLGEKSLSTEVRQQKLAQAEFIDYEKARMMYDNGQYKFKYYQLKEASNHFRSSLNLLKKINFYQDLTDQILINHLEFEELQKLLYLSLAKCGIEQNEDSEKVEDYLYSYLSLEDKLMNIKELESYLKDKGLIESKLEGSFDDLKQLSFQILLSFKQSRYRDIMKVGSLLQQSFIIIPEDKKKDYMKILQIIGDSFFKSDFMYDAEEFFQKALEIEPDNLSTLSGLLQIYERLNKVREFQVIDTRIEKRLSPREIADQDIIIEKGKRYSYTLAFGGRKVILNLRFRRNLRGADPLIAVFFNRKVVWEDYSSDDTISVSLDTKVGDNVLVVMPVNTTVRLVKVGYY
jgi:hypothetical protein